MRARFILIALVAAFWASAVHAAPAGADGEQACADGEESVEAPDSDPPPQAVPARRSRKVWNPYAQEQVGERFSRYSGEDEYEGSAPPPVAAPAPRRGGKGGGQQASRPSSGSSLRVRRG